MNSSYILQRTKGPGSASEIMVGLFRLTLVKEGRKKETERTCVIMGKLAGTVGPAAIRGHIVDDVILVKDVQ